MSEKLLSLPQTRRDFLMKVAVLGGTGLVMGTMKAWGMDMSSRAASPPMLSGSGNGKTVLILGAGLAGMTAAYELGKVGYQCTILEARDFAGGRCQTARAGFRLTELGGEEQQCRFDEGYYINHGPWRIPFNHQSTLHYTREFGVPLEIFVNDNDASYVYFEGGDGSLASKPVRQFEIKADLRGQVNELLAKSIHSNRLDLPLTEDDKKRLLDYLVNEGYLSASDFSYLGTGGRGYKVNPGAGTVPGPGEASDPLELKDLLASGMGHVYRSVHSFTQQATMFQPVGGMDRIARAFEQRVGNRIRYGMEVGRIHQRGDQVVISGKKLADNSDFELVADYCLCTIPLSVLRHIDTDFSPAFSDAIGQVAYEPTCKIGLQMKRRFWEEDHFIYGGHIRTNLKGIGNISLPSDHWQSGKGVLLGYYNFGANAAEVSAKSLEERTRFALEGGEKVFPGSYQASCESSFSVAWHRVKYNLGGWAEWNDQARATAYPTLLNAEGRVLLAGEHLSYLTGWMAGAIESSWQQMAKLHTMAQQA
ncbi:flavin monoamine oxidase family protein [Zobellella sp. DQSA1]|uniref:flavin monoamine oxidase family protein n=1 Tax=Zobellella sp. DQSA1 TaxID=3342386 RepID=UPI0035BF0471